MIILLSSVLAVALACLAASTANAGQHSRFEKHCLSQADTNQISSRFGDVLSKRDSDIGNYSQTAEALIGEHYYAISDSNLSLQNLTLNDRHTNVGKKDFISQIEENGSFGVENGNLSVAYPVDCNKVIWYFQARGYGAKKDLHGGRLNTQRVKGFYLIFVDEQNLIDHVYYELNSLAQGIDAGIAKLIGDASSKAPSFNDILYPSAWNWDNKARYVPNSEYRNAPFEQTNGSIFWRGSTTGGMSSGTGQWKGHSRQRFLHVLNDINVAGITQILRLPSSEGNLRHTAVLVRTLTEHVQTDVHTVYGVRQPWDIDSLQETTEFDIDGPIDLQRHWQFKYLLDLDGTGFSGRFLPFMHSRSLPLSTDHQKWMRALASIAECSNYA